MATNRDRRAGTIATVTELSIGSDGSTIRETWDFGLVVESSEAHLVLRTYTRQQRAVNGRRFQREVTYVRLSVFSEAKGPRPSVPDDIKRKAIDAFARRVRVDTAP